MPAEVTAELPFSFSRELSRADECLRLSEMYRRDGALASAARKLREAATHLDSAHRIKSEA